MRPVTLAASGLAALALAGVLAHCGGSGGSSSTARPRPLSGAAVFTQQCSVCHSLIGNESLHRQGGDLLGYSYSRQELALQIREMPVRKPLTAAELAAVDQYVWAAQHRARGR